MRKAFLFLLLDRQKIPTSKLILSIFHFHPCRLHPLTTLLMQPRVTPALAQGQVRLCHGTGQGQQPGVPLLPPALQGGGTPAPSCPLGLTGGSGGPHGF